MRGLLSKRHALNVKAKGPRYNGGELLYLFPQVCNSQLYLLTMSLKYANADIQNNVSLQSVCHILFIDVCSVVFCTYAGVEDGQTVRMPVGNREIFITFRVSCDVF